MVGLVLLITMLLSDWINNATAVILMAPVGLGVAAAIGAKSLSVRLLEELAILHRDVRHIVEYKRRRKQLKRIESIAAAAKGNRVYPLFNQVRSPSGRLASSDPSLFDEDGLKIVRPCLGTALRDSFPSRRKAFDAIDFRSGYQRTYHL